MIKELAILSGQMLHVGRASVHKVFGYTDIAGKNQDISTFSVV
jgi:hypothetical protein